MGVDEAVLDLDVGPARMVEVPADVADALGVHDVHVLVFAVQLPGRGELGLLARTRHFHLGRWGFHVGVEPSANIIKHYSLGTRKW